MLSAYNFFRNSSFNIISGLLKSVIILFLIVITINAQNEMSTKNHEDFNSANFDESSIIIDNKYLPMKPWTRLVYEGTTVEDGETLDHRVVITVTDMTKVIDGVNCVVTWDLDYSDGELVEAELAFFAQDKDGNVWRMGEYPEEYEEGKFVDQFCWIHGIDGSIAGISMQSNPEIGMPDYSQGWAPSVDFTDRAQIDQMSIKDCVPVDCYEDVLVIAESSLAEPGIYQLKYFAPDVGNIRVGWRGDDQNQENLELVELQELVLGAKDQALEEVMKLEQNAYERSEDIYGKTSPMEKRKD